MRSSRLSLWLSGAVAVALGAVWIGNNVVFYEAKSVVAAKVEEMTNARLQAIDPKLKVTASFNSNKLYFWQSKQNLELVLDGPGQKLVLPVSAHKDFFSYTFVPDFSKATLNDEPALKALQLYNIKTIDAALTLSPLSRTADLAAQVSYFNSLGKLSNLESLAVTLRDFALNNKLTLSTRLLPPINKKISDATSSAASKAAPALPAAEGTTAANVPNTQSVQLDHKVQNNALPADALANAISQGVSDNASKQTAQSHAINAANNAATNIASDASSLNKSTRGAIAEQGANSVSNAATPTQKLCVAHERLDQKQHLAPNLETKDELTKRLNQEKFQLVQELAFAKYQLGLRFDTGLYDNKLLEENPKAYDARLVKEIARTFSYITAVKNHVGFKEVGTINLVSHMADATHMRSMIQIDNFSNDIFAIKNLELKLSTHGISPVREIHDLSLKLPYLATIDDANIGTEINGLALTLNTSPVEKLDNIQKLEHESTTKENLKELDDFHFVQAHYQLSVDKVDNMHSGVFQGSLGPFSLDSIATLLSSTDQNSIAKVLAEMIENNLTLTVTPGAHIIWEVETLPKLTGSSLQDGYDLGALLAGPIPHINLPIKLGGKISVSPDAGALEFYKSATDEARMAIARSALILSASIDADAEVATNVDPREVLWPLVLRGLKPNIHYIIFDHGARTSVKWHYPLNGRSTLYLNNQRLF